MPGYSFAGQQETFLNISGIDNVLLAVKQVFASLYNDRAIAYRVHQGFDHGQVALSAGVQRMVRSDSGASGVLFTLDTETGFRDAVFITASWGLGETVVQGAVDPDEYMVFKPLLGSEDRVLYRYDLNRAKQFLAQSGYPDGFDLTLTIGTGSGSRTIDSSLLASEP